MNLREWVASKVDYGRELVDSGLEGASKGRMAYLNGAPLTPFLGDLNRQALKLATLGAYRGWLAPQTSRANMDRPTFTLHVLEQIFVGAIRSSAFSQPPRSPTSYLQPVTLNDLLPAKSREFGLCKHCFHISFLPQNCRACDQRSAPEWASRWISNRWKLANARIPTQM